MKDAKYSLILYYLYQKYFNKVTLMFRPWFPGNLVWILKRNARSWQILALFSGHAEIDVTCYYTLMLLELLFKYVEVLGIVFTPQLFDIPL